MGGLCQDEFILAVEGEKVYIKVEPVEPVEPGKTREYVMIIFTAGDEESEMYCPACKLRVDDDTIERCPICKGKLEDERKNGSAGGAEFEVSAPAVDDFSFDLSAALADQKIEFDPRKLGLAPEEDATGAESRGDDIRNLDKLWQGEDLESELEGVMAEAFTLDEVCRQEAVETESADSGSSSSVADSVFPGQTPVASEAAAAVEPAEKPVTAAPVSGRVDAGHVAVAPAAAASREPAKPVEPLGTALATECERPSSSEKELPPDDVLSETSPPAAGGGGRSLFLLLLVLLLAGAAGGGFYWWQQQQKVSGSAASGAAASSPAEKSSPGVVETARTGSREAVAPVAEDMDTVSVPKPEVVETVAETETDTGSETGAEAGSEARSEAGSQAGIEVETAKAAKTASIPLPAGPVNTEIAPEPSAAEGGETADNVAFPAGVAAMQEKIRAGIGPRETVEPGGIEIKPGPVSEPVPEPEPESAPEPEPASASEPAKTSSAQVGNVPEKTSVPAPAPVEAKPRPKKIYAVQIGSFKTPKRARRQVERLKKKGFDAEILEVDLGDRGHWWRVIVKAGPDKTSARNLRTNITQTFPRDQTRILKLGSE